MPPLEKKERIPIKSLRTYQGDMQEAVEKNGESRTTIFIAEQKRKIENHEEPKMVVDHPLRNKMFVSFGSIFLLLGLAIVTTAYYIKSTEKTLVDQQTKTLMSFSKEIVLDVSSSTTDSFLNSIRTERSSFKLPINSVLYLNTNDKNAPASIEKIMSLVGPNQPSSLTRSFSNEYMLGIYSYDTNEAFIILKVRDYASSYSGMLSWETKMPSDLNKIFNLGPELIAGGVSFTDLAFKNKDLRVLKDFNGKTQLLYSFIDKDTLVITKNESIFSAIIGRLSVNGQTR